MLLFDARHVKARSGAFAPPAILLALIAIPTFGFAQTAAPVAAPSPASLAPVSPAPAVQAPQAVAPVAAAPAIPAAAAAPKPAAAEDMPIMLTCQARSRRDCRRNLSPWGMFLNADIIVKVVMVGLALASLLTWTVYIAKSIELFAAKQRAQNQLAILARRDARCRPRRTRGRQRPGGAHGRRRRRRGRSFGRS